jgi:hypothetical protein
MSAPRRAAIDLRKHPSESIGQDEKHYVSEMKTRTHMKLAITILSLTAATLLADEVVTRTTTSTGTIHEYTPGTTFVVKESTGPVTYRYGKKVTYVTKKGTVLTDDAVRTRIRVGSPVSVDYVTEGDTRVVNRVVVDDEDDDD